MITDSSVYAEPSWADTLKGYRQTTNSLPWRPEQHAPTQRVTTHTVARKQRELDPLLMRFRDPAREAARSAQEAATAAERLDAARARQLHYEQRFDIVNHRPRGGGGDDDARQPAYRQRPPDTRLTFNILNHQTLPGHPEPAARSAPEGGEAAAVPPARSRKPYNILNNRFLHDHDGKVAAERAAAAARTEEQFWQTHDYHPIEGRYYHPDKEKEFEALRRAAAAVHGQAQRRRLPPSVVHSEGQTYDILTAAAKDARRAAEAEAIADRALRQKQGARTEAAQKTRALEEEDLAAARSLGRVHPARFASTSGYDPLTNVGFQGRTGQPRPPAHPQAPARAFDRARHDHRGGGPPTAAAAAAAAATGPLDVFGRPAAVAGAGGWALGGGVGAAAAPGAAASSRGGGDRGGGLAAAGGESLRSASARSGAYYRDSPGGGSRGGLSSAPSGKGGSTFGEGSGRPLVPKLTIPKLPSSSRSAVRTGGFNQ